MPKVDVVVETKVSTSVRARQLESMFDVPRAETSKLEWHVDMPIEEQDWNVGLIVGPSGCGKSTIAKKIFGDHVDVPLKWGADAVVDDFDSEASMKDISAVCRAVGFNTIPAWLRPYEVLSNGEKFRVELARRLMECGDPIVVDEFTSVVDRQVGKIGSHAVQKYVRKTGKKFVAVTCHSDVIEWLQPDWVFSPAEGSFVRRSVQQRPPIEVEISRVPYRYWHLFSRFHYLTNRLHKGAKCFALWANGELAAFAAFLFKPSRKNNAIKTMGVSRVVCFPDWQGLGLGPCLVDYLSSAWNRVGFRTRTYPAHPAYIRTFDQSPSWKLIRKPGRIKAFGKTSYMSKNNPSAISRPCAVFEFVGPRMEDKDEARRLLSI